MSLHNEMYAFMRERKDEIGVLTAVASTALHEVMYIDMLAHSVNPVDGIVPKRIPSIKTMNEYLDMEGPLMTAMIEKFIDQFVCHPLVIGCSPEMKILFHPDKIELTKCVFVAFILPQVQKIITELISESFMLGNTSKDALFMEDPHLDMFNGKIGEQMDELMAFIVDQAAVVFRSSSGEHGYHLKGVSVTTNERIHMTDKSILRVKALTNRGPSVYFTDTVMKHANTSDIIWEAMWVTGTKFTNMLGHENVAVVGDELVAWNIRTSPYNAVQLMIAMHDDCEMMKE